MIMLARVQSIDVETPSAHRTTASTIRFGLGVFLIFLLRSKGREMNFTTYHQDVRNAARVGVL
jgi:hypothetical protein